MEQEHEVITKFMKGIGESIDLEELKKIHDDYPHIPWHYLKHPKTEDTILHVASRYGQTEIVQYIVDTYRPVACNYINTHYKTPLHEAAQCGHPEIAEILLNNGAFVNSLKIGDWTPLMLACTRTYNNYLMTSKTALKLIKLLLDRSAEINFRNKDGWTVLHIVAREGDVEILKLLVRHNVDINQTTKNGRTALHIAALHGREEMVEELLRYRSKVDAVDSCGNCPIHESVLGGHLPVFILLLQKSQNISLTTNSCGYTVLHLAASKGRMEILQYLVLKLKVDCNIQVENELFTPLHCAARHEQQDAFFFLISNGCDEHILDKHDRTPIDYFVQNCFKTAYASYKKIKEADKKLKETQDVIVS